MKRLLLFLLLTLPAIAQQQVTIRVCTYNVLNYGQTVPIERRAAMKRVFDSVNADIIVLHEIAGGLGEEAIGNQVFGRYQRGYFTNGPDTDNAMFYDSSKIEVTGRASVPTELRNIDDWILLVKGSAA